MRNTDNVLSLVLAVARDMPTGPAGRCAFDEGLDFANEIVHALGDLLGGPSEIIRHNPHFPGVKM